MIAFFKENKIGYKSIEKDNIKNRQQIKNEKKRYDLKKYLNNQEKQACKNSYLSDSL